MAPSLPRALPYRAVLWHAWAGCHPRYLAGAGELEILRQRENHHLIACPGEPGLLPWTPRWGLRNRTLGRVLPSEISISSPRAIGMVVCCRRGRIDLAGTGAHAHHKRGKEEGNPVVPTHRCPIPGVNWRMNRSVPDAINMASSARARPPRWWSVRTSVCSCRLAHADLCQSAQITLLSPSL